MARLDSLTAPTKWVEGKYSGVDLSNGQDKAVVCVRDVGQFKKLYYHVGAIDGVKIAWGDTRDYDTGRYPSVALIEMGGSLYAIEVHQSSIYNSCYYKVGKVKTSNKSILWEHSVCFSGGKNPKLAANDNGIVVAVKEMSWSYHNNLQLVVGVFDPTAMKINWKPDQTVPDFCGVEPDVAINPNKIVIACCNKGIRFKMGTINNDDHSICWVDASYERRILGEGDYGWSTRPASPSIALNSHGTIVETHYVYPSWPLMSKSVLSYHYGRVSKDSILWEDESISRNLGEYPCISLSNDGTIFEVQKTGIELLHRVRNQQDPDLLHKHEDLPGAILSQPLNEARVTSRGKEIYLEEEIGASLSIRRNSVAGEVKVGLAAVFFGSHEIPEDMEPVSPAYVVTADKPVELRKDMTLRMQHTVENTADVVLVEAAITGSPGCCILSRSAKAIEHKLHFVVVKVKKLTSTIYRLVKPKRRKGEVAKFYSARLYKSVLGIKVTAVFCVCLEHPTYTTFCDKAIAKDYPDLFNEAEKTVINALIITSDSVAVMKAEGTTWTVTMDRSMISRSEVDSPERYNVELSELSDYPPRIVLDLTPPGPTSPPADLKVQGLKGSHFFTVKIPSPVEPHRSQSQNTMSVNIAKFHDATVGFEAKVFTEAESPLVLCARSMAGVMAKVKPLLNDPENVNDLVKKVEEIEDLIKNVVSLTEGAKNVQGSVTTVSMISHQLKTVAPAMRKSAGGDPEKWQGAVDVLVGNSVNLMNSIGELIKDAQVAAVESRTTDGGISLKLLNLIKWRDERVEQQKFCLVDKVSSKWESFGYRLEISQNMLDAWREECLNNSARCWCKVMHHWLTGGDTPDYPAIWDGLYEMLEDVGYSEVASQLREAVLAAKV